MHAKQHPTNAARAGFCALFLLGSSGCALLANLGAGTDEVSSDPGRPGSRSPDAGIATAQREGGVTGACSADLANDSSNCGFCGHGCAGAACNAGLCAPVTISIEPDVRQLAVDAEDRVFFTTEHEVRGCAAGSLAACASLLDKGVAAEAMRSWGLGAGIGREGSGPDAGGAGGSAPALQPRALALYGDRFFVAEQTHGAIFACSKAGCSSKAAAIVFPESTPAFAGGLAVNSSSVIWGERNGVGEADLPKSASRTMGSFLAGPLTREVTRIEMSAPDADAYVFRAADGVFALAASPATTPTEVLQGSSVRDFAFDPQFAYVAATTSVIRVDRKTAARTTLVELNGEELVRLVADVSGVYATVKGGFGQKVVRVRQDGIDTMATSSVIGPIALSRTWLYYADNDAIRRVAR